MREGKPTSGRPAEAETPTMAGNVGVFVNNGRRLTLQEVTNQFSIGKASARQILREKKKKKKNRYKQGKC